jgi:GAF domain-containing protein
MMASNPSKDGTSPTPEEATRLLYKNWRERFAMPLLIGSLILGAFALIFSIQSAGSMLLSAIFIVTYIMTGIVTVIRFSYSVRISVFLLIVYVLGLSELFRYGILGDGSFFFLGLIVLATLLLSPRVGIITMAINTLTIILFGWLMLNKTITPLAPSSPAILQDWVSGGVMIILFGTITVLGFQRLEKAFLEAQIQIDANLNTIKDERNNLEKKVVERTQQLRRVNEIRRTITAVLNPDELLTRAAHLIGDEFECYYTAIFLTDATGQWAELKAATGDAGKVLRENKHHVNINGANPIGTVIRTKQALIISDTSLDSTQSENPAEPFTRFSWHGISISTQFSRSDNPLLPYSRSQIVLPLIIGEQVIGALEMHSTKENIFAQQDADTYQNMANQVAIALENSRLFTEAQQSIYEMSATQQQYLQEVWLSLAADQKLEHISGDSDSAGNHEIKIPLSLRDQVIGEINMSSFDEWTPEQKNLIESIAAQAALALENARLVEESQSVAMRERLVNEITSKIWASTTMDSILQTTVRELGRALEAAEVDIEVSMGDNNE